MSRIAHRSGIEARVELQLHEHASARQYRDLGVFVRYCVVGIERDVGRAEWWRVAIAPTRDGFSCDVIIQDAETVIQATGRGLDGALAAWDALCSIEQHLRDGRAHRVSLAGGA